MVYPLTKKELYCGTTLKHLCSFYRNIVARKGIKPISAGLGAAAQSLYQRAKYILRQQICGVNWESNPIFLGSLPSVISYLIKNSVSRSYLKTIILTTVHYHLSLCDL